MTVKVTRRHRAAQAVIAEIGEGAHMIGLTMATLTEALEALRGGDVAMAELYASVAAVELRRMLEKECA